MEESGAQSESHVQHEGAPERKEVYQALCGAEDGGEVMNNWISVKDRFPEAKYGESNSVLTVSETGVIDVFYFDGGCWCKPTGEIRNMCTKITHWMPLPELPKEEKPCSKTE